MTVVSNILIEQVLVDDYCKLLGSEINLKSEIRKYERDGDVEDEIVSTQTFDVPITIPPKYSH